MRLVPRCAAFFSLLTGLAILAPALGGYSLRADSLLTESPGPADFVLAAEGRSTAIWLEPGTDKSILRAAGDLAADVERVTGIRSQVSQDPASLHGPVVLIGMLEQGKLIDGLAAAARLLSGVRGEDKVLIHADRPDAFVYQVLPGLVLPNRKETCRAIARRASADRTARLGPGRGALPWRSVRGLNPSKTSDLPGKIRVSKRFESGRSGR